MNRFFTNYLVQDLIVIGIAAVIVTAIMTAIVMAAVTATSIVLAVIVGVIVMVIIVTAAITIAIRILIVIVTIAVVIIVDIGVIVVGIVVIAIDIYVTAVGVVVIAVDICIDIVDVTIIAVGVGIVIDIDVGIITIDIGIIISQLGQVCQIRRAGSLNARYGERSIWVHIALDLDRVANLERTVADYHRINRQSLPIDSPLIAVYAFKCARISDQRCIHFDSGLLGGGCSRCAATCTEHIGCQQD